ncbi:MAG TPA: O-antigen ligase family protein, partial [Verrucomicrobiae bacterium]|nr:O-antigen ligase family protein [Verrucomicrobiae bacterium]
APCRWWRHLLLVCAVIMASCPIISTSRGGALVAFGLLAISAVGLFGRSLIDIHAPRLPRPSSLSALLVFFMGAPLLGLALGWQTLKPRLASLNQGFRERERICAVARKIARDYPIYGTGPGTYEAVSTLYRPGADFWPAQAHNDWLEFRITFGIAGCALLVAALSLVALRCLLPGGLSAGKYLPQAICLAITGCLVHARFDFPFQVHSVLGLFVILSAVLFSLNTSEPGPGVSAAPGCDGN